VAVQVASIGSDQWHGGPEDRFPLFLQLLRWLTCHGGRLLQLQCSTSFSHKVGWHLHALGMSLSGHSSTCTKAAPACVMS
jgi:hypothetical protein